MLYNIDKKIGILLVPKTGSYALYNILESKVHLDYKTHNHATVDRFTTQLHRDGVSAEFQYLFGMYRDPIDRFLSGCNYFRHHWPRYSTTILEHLGYNLNFFDLVQPNKSLTDAVDAVSAETIIDSFRTVAATNNEDKIIKRLRVWLPQCDYLDYPGVELLDYRDMIGSVNKILAAFDVEPVEVVPRVNVTEHKTRTRESLSEQDIAAIKEYYRADYEFFEKNGISFKV